MPGKGWGTYLFLTTTLRGEGCSQPRLVPDEGTEAQSSETHADSEAGEGSPPAAPLPSWLPEPWIPGLSLPLAGSVTLNSKAPAAQVGGRAQR